MAYFSPFPKITYLFDIGGIEQLKVVRDIVLNIRFKEKILDNVSLFDDYVIGDHTTPELISEQLYGSPFYHWIIMLVNDRYNHVKDFPMTEDALTAYTISKYKDVVTLFYPFYGETIPDFTYRKYKTNNTDDYNTVLNAYVLVGDLPLYRNSQGVDVPFDDPDAHQVTNIEYETSEFSSRYSDQLLTMEEYVMRSPKIQYGEELYRGNFDGIDCNKNTPWSTRITNLAYETTINESLRRIRVINKAIIVQVSEEIYSLFNDFNGTN